ncbi:hypothetical protein Q9L58_000539 [Maublancomyces gigas]|uniref:Uncharacterized protein n=1 Tax=Discina gigas TaxID=1032678 RepID=A0ABR3GWG5_9PEZI
MSDSVPPLEMVDTGTGLSSSAWATGESHKCSKLPSEREGSSRILARTRAKSIEDNVDLVELIEKQVEMKKELRTKYGSVSHAPPEDQKCYETLYSKVKWKRSRLRKAVLKVLNQQVNLWRVSVLSAAAAQLVDLPGVNVLSVVETPLVNLSRVRLDIESKTTLILVQPPSTVSPVSQPDEILVRVEQMEREMQRWTDERTVEREKERAEMQQWADERKKARDLIWAQLAANKMKQSGVMRRWVEERRVEREEERRLWETERGEITDSQQS